MPQPLTSRQCSKKQPNLSASSSMLEEEGEREGMWKQADILRSYRNPASNHKASGRQASNKINGS